ncbi:hypothetical protein EV426DRAFT_533131 [Tirmania nivea]|nr:hypothetical protein EV426DRAFT_533131 [Tirmania nivea]
MGDSDRKIFIPLTLSKEVPQPPYTRADPVVQTFTEFSRNHKLQEEVQYKLADLTVKAFEKDRHKFGRNMGCSIMWLWFQYPTAPPPKYEQSGLTITPKSITWTTREIHPFYFYRLMVAIWPQWMFNSLRTSFQRVAKAIKDEINAAGTEEPELDSEGNKSNPILIIPHPELTGKVAFDETLGNFRNTLRRTPTGKNLPPPPKGHIKVTGIVQITGEKLLIHVDVDATFDPATCDRFTFYYMKVRYVAYAAQSGRRAQKVPTTEQQHIVEEALRHAPPSVAAKEGAGEGLLGGAKAVMQEAVIQEAAARKTRVESGDRAAGSGSSAVAAVRNKDAEIAGQGTKGEEERVHVTPKDHALIPPPPVEKTLESEKDPGRVVEEPGRKTEQHDGPTDEDLSDRSAPPSTSESDP